MQKDSDKWMHCLLFKQEKCPNQEIINKAYIWQEKQPGKEFDTLKIEEIEKAINICINCKDYIEHIP